MRRPLDFIFMRKLRQASSFCTVQMKFSILVRSSISYLFFLRGGGGRYPLLPKNKGELWKVESETKIEIQKNYWKLTLTYLNECQFHFSHWNALYSLFILYSLLHSFESIKVCSIYPCLSFESNQVHEMTEHHSIFRQCMKAMFTSP